MSDYSEIFGREPEPWREPLGALRLTLTGDPEEVDVVRAQHEVEELVKVLDGWAKRKIQIHINQHQSAAVRRMRTGGAQLPDRREVTAMSETTDLIALARRAEEAERQRDGWASRMMEFANAQQEIARLEAAIREARERMENPTFGYTSDVYRILTNALKGGEQG